MQTVALIAQNNLTSTDSTGAQNRSEKMRGYFYEVRQDSFSYDRRDCGTWRSSGSGFSQKIIGDGMAVIPSEGKLLQSGGRRGYFHGGQQSMRLACVRQKAWSF